MRTTSPVETRSPAGPEAVADAGPKSAPVASVPQVATPVAAVATPVAIVATPAAGPSSGPNQADVPRPDGEPPRPTCTVAQLRRFIKSRPWIPMHELRRRFGIYGADDDVSPIRVGDRTLFVGLPPAESRLMAELLGGGDVGYELSLDPWSPIVVGVYPMRPVPRG